MTANRARSEKLLQFVAFLLITSLLTVSWLSVAQADPAQITAAEKEAQELRDLVDELDAALSEASENYNYAAQQLEDTQTAQANTQAKLIKAESQLAASQERLLTRLAEIYKAGRTGVLEVLVGADSLSDLVSRARQLSRISQQDAEIVAEVESYLAEVDQHQAELAQQEKDAQELVASLAEAKSEVEAQLAAQEQALRGKETQLAQLREEERVRQAELAAAARAAAAAEAEAAARARAAAEVAEQQAATTTTTARATTVTTKAATTTTKARTTTTQASSNESPSSGGSGSSATRSEVVEIALQYVGTPYLWAGASPSGFDCSGFVMYVFAKVGIRLPHSSAMQYGYGTHVSKSELRPGDLVFFYNPIHHVGIYIGNGQMINARTGGVQIESAFWSSYVGATSILP